MAWQTEHKTSKPRNRTQNNAKNVCENVCGKVKSRVNNIDCLTGNWVWIINIYMLYQRVHVCVCIYANMGSENVYIGGKK